MGLAPSPGQVSQTLLELETLLENTEKESAEGRTAVNLSFTGPCLKVRIFLRDHLVSVGSAVSVLSLPTTKTNEKLSKLQFDKQV